MALEIERKYLLKSVPRYVFERVKRIVNFYPLDSKGRYRYEECEHSKKYFYTEKTPVDWYNDEEEVEIDFETFNNRLIDILSNNRYKAISKIRREIKIKGLLWQVDSLNSECHFTYSNLYNIQNVPQLIIAECELPDIDYKLTLPDLIEEVLLLDVTEMKQFSNFNLASEP